MDPSRYKKYRMPGAPNRIDSTSASTTYKSRPSVVSRPIVRSRPVFIHEQEDQVVSIASQKVFGLMGDQKLYNLEKEKTIPVPEKIIEEEKKSKKPSLFSRISLNNYLKNFKYIRELRFFLSGATLALGIASFAYYGYFSQPVSRAETDPVSVKINIDGTETHVTASGETVNVSPGVDINKVDTRPPKPIEPDMPKRLLIPAMRLNASIRSLGLAKDGSLAVPNYYNQVGWYDKSARPGSPGTIVIDGHYDINDDGAVFKRIDKVEVGSEIQIIRGDGQTLTYRVEATELYDRNAVPMQNVIGSDGKERLNIITCFGEWVPNEKTYTQRMVLYAVRI